ncbi:MAG: mandelate racemase [Actinomycetota bacterium]|nr:mandelate racemase [Actinomycetota bacterium]
MGLAKLETFVVALPKRRDHNWASKMLTPIGSHVLTRIEDTEGRVGWGETPAIATWGGNNSRNYGETPGSARHVIESYLWPAIEGLPAEPQTVHAAMDRVIKGNPYAKASLDIAVYDLAGKSLGIPVSVLLGGRVRDRIEVCHSLGIMEDDIALEEAEIVVSEGIRTIKVKTGVDPERDVRIVRRLRETLGSEIKIRVDANEGYDTVSQAVRITKQMIDEADIFLCEQPLRTVKELSEVARRVDVPVMADESAWSALDIVEIAATGTIEAFSLYVTKPGGLFRARQQAAIAETLGLWSDIGGSIEMGIGNAANLHLGASVPIATLPSVCPVNAPAGTRTGIAGNYYSDDLITEPLSFEDGALLVPDGPGLGVEVDEEKVKASSL